MYTLLLDIAKKIEEETEIKTTVMPIFQLANTVQLVIYPKSLMKYENGADRLGRDGYKSTENELHIDVFLKAKGKTKDFVETFYSNVELANQKFLRPYSFKLGTGDLFNVKVDLRKVLEGGEYWTNEDGTEDDDIYILSEKWEGVIKRYDYK